MSDCSPTRFANFKDLSPAGAYYQLECAGLINIMVHDILQSCAYYEMYGDKLALTTKRNSQLSEIIRYIEEHSAERVTLSDLAKHMQLSASYLSHLF